MVMGQIKNFKQFVETNESDYDYRIMERKISGKLTKKRYKLLDSLCRENSFRTGFCGHEHDCCGCLCGQSVSFTYKQNAVVIRLTQSFNY